MFTKTTSPQFETIGRHRKLVGFIGELTDESGVVLHSQSYATKPEAERALDALAHELLIDYAERGLVDELPEVVQCDICDNDRTIRADNGGTAPCPYCSAPITVGQRFTHFGFGTGTVVNITDDERLNVQVKFDSPSRFGSKFWFDASEVIRPHATDDLPGIENEPEEPPVYPAPGGRAVTLQSLAIEARITTCAYCRGIHHIQKCQALRHAVFAEVWKGADLGRGLCQLRWRNHDGFDGFTQLLANATPARLVEYAESYVAFIRENRPESSLTTHEVLDRWLPLIGGDPGPAAPALRMVA
jgi:hypothetical protein